MAIVLVEALVCLAVIAYFRRTDVDKRVWHTMIAPVLAFIGLLLGLYLLMSRFGLLAGTAGPTSTRDPQSWGLNATGWALSCCRS